MEESFGHRRVDVVEFLFPDSSRLDQEPAGRGVPQSAVTTSGCSSTDSSDLKSLSVIAGLTLWNFYFQIHPGSIKSPQVVEFLKALLRHLGVPLLILWDGATIHRSRLVKDFIASTKGMLTVEPLPAYAPELNPVEYLWAHLKQHEIGNLIVCHAWELNMDPPAALRRMRRRPRKILACFAQAELWP